MCVSSSGELEAETEYRKDDDDDDPELKKLRAGLSGLSINNDFLYALSLTIQQALS